MLLDRIDAIIRENGLFEKGQRVVIGLSGGPDSMSLLHILLALAPQWNLTLALAHLDHRIRSDSQEDVRFLERVAKETHLPLHVKTVDVPRLADQRRTGIEETARDARYRFFSEVAQDANAQAVALAHNADDQVETILMRLLRGTGMRGLQGIPIKRPLLPGVHVVRPLLETTREEIVYFLKERNLTFILDQSNEDTSYTRNKVRMQLLPLLEKDYNPNIRQVVRHTAALLSEDEAFLSDVCAQIYPTLVLEQSPHAVRFNATPLRAQPANLQKRFVRHAFEHLGNLEQLTWQHVADIVDHLHGSSQAWQLDLPGARWAYYQDGELLLTTERLEADNVEQFNYPLQLPSAVYIPEISVRLSVELLETDTPLEVLKTDRASLYLDYELLQGSLCLRNRKAGDRFFPFGSMGSKKIKDFFIDKKVPVDERDRIPLLCDHARVVAVIGHTIDNRVRVTAATRKMIKIQSL